MKQTNLKKAVAEKMFRNELCAVVKSFGNDNSYIGIDIEEWDDVNYPELFVHCLLPENIDFIELENAIKKILLKYNVCSEGVIDHLGISDRFLDENIYYVDFIEQTLNRETDYTVEKLDEDLWEIDGVYYLIKCN